MEPLRRRFVIPHAFACRVYGCRYPVRWLDMSDRGVGVGWCDDHRSITGGERTPIVIYGEEGENGGWMSWPLDIRTRIAIDRAEGRAPW